MSGAQLGSALRTPAELRRAIQASSGPVRAVAERLGVNPKTVRRWRARTSVDSHKPGPRSPRSKVLSPPGEALAAVLRATTDLALDDCLFALQAFMPELSRASLHRCLKRHGLSRRADDWKVIEPGVFDLHAVELDGAAPRLRLLLAIERSSRHLVARLEEARPGQAEQAALQWLADVAPTPVKAVYVARGGPRSSGVGRSEALQVRRLDPGRERRVRQAGGLLREAASALGLPGRGLDELRGGLERIVERYNETARLKALGGLSPREHVGSSRARRTQADPIVDGLMVSQRGPGGAREAILQAARALLSKVGPEGLTMSRVARLAGVNRGTAYLHFESRAQLLAAAAEWSSKRLTAAVFGDGGPPRRRDGLPDIATVAKRLANVALEAPEMSQAWLFQMLALQDPWQDQFWREYCGRGKQFHATPVAADGIDDEVLSVIMLAGAFLWPIWARAKRPAGATEDACADRFAREILRLSMFGIVRPEYYPEIAEEPASQAAGPSSGCP